MITGHMENPTTVRQESYYIVYWITMTSHVSTPHGDDNYILILSFTGCELITKMQMSRHFFTSIFCVFSKSFGECDIFIFPWIKSTVMTEMESLSFLSSVKLGLFGASHVLLKSTIQPFDSMEDSCIIKFTS